MGRDRLKVIEQSNPPKPALDLGQSALSGSFWLSLGRWSIRGASAVITILLARLLSVDEYGVAALMLLLYGLLAVPGMGLQAAVIQREADPGADHLNVAWTYDKLLVNLAGAALILFFAPEIAAFFKEPQITAMIQVLAIIPILQTIENNALVVLTRALNYRRRVWLEAADGVATAIVVIPLAFVFRNAWALVLALVAGQALRTIVSYIVYPHAPRVCFNRKIFKELFPFGRWMIGQQLLVRVKTRMDQFILGMLLGAASLGVFQIGSRFSEQLLGDFNNTARKLFFPIYAKMQGSRQRLMRNYLRVLQVTLFMAGPLCAGLFVAAEPVVLFIFGDKWLPAVPVMKILIIAGLLKVIIATSHPLFRGQGKPAYEFGIYLTEAAIAIPLMIFLTLRYGITGMALAVLVTQVVQVPVLLWMLRRALEMRVGAFLNAVAQPLVGIVLSGGILFVVYLSLEGQSILLQLVTLAACEMLAYGIFLVLGKRYCRWESLDVLQSHLVLLFRRLQTRVR